MAVDLLFRGVLPRRKRTFNLIENLLNRLSEAEVNSRYRCLRYSIQFITNTLAKFTTLICSSLINYVLFNTTQKAPEYLSFDSMSKSSFADAVCM